MLAICKDVIGFQIILFIAVDPWNPADPYKTVIASHESQAKVYSFQL